MSLCARDLVVRRGARTVLDGVDLAVGPGEFVALIGPNGAGKSTLLAAIAGDLDPAGGQILLDGRPLTEWSPGERARRRAVLPQASTLDFPFSVLEVVAMGRTPYGRPGKADAAIARRALALVGLPQLAARPYTRLSGGERQRVHLARVLTQLWDPALDGEGGMRGPAPYLMLDEPTASQDLGSQKRVLETARRFADAGGGVLCVLHALDQAARYADRLCLMADGRITASGPPAAVLTAAALEDAFGVPVHIHHPPELDHPLVIPR